MALTEKITILTEDSKLKSLIQQFNEGSIAASKLAAALRQLAGSTKANTEINAQVKAVQQQVAAITRTNSKAVLNQAQAYNQATAAAKKFQVTIVRTAEESAAATGGLSAASPLGPGGEMMPGWVPPARYQAWADNFRKTHVFDEVTGSWRQMTQAEIANAKATDRAAQAQRRAQIAIGRTGNRMMGGFRTALLLRSSMRELISASQLFTSNTAAMQSEMNKFTMAASDAAWITMGLSSLIGGPAAGLVAGVMTFAAVLGDEAGAQDKATIAIEKFNAHLTETMGKLYGMKNDIMPGLINQFDSLASAAEPGLFTKLLSSVSTAQVGSTLETVGALHGGFDSASALLRLLGGIAERAHKSTTARVHGSESQLNLAARQIVALSKATVAQMNFNATLEHETSLTKAMLPLQDAYNHKLSEAAVQYDAASAKAKEAIENDKKLHDVLLPAQETSALAQIDKQIGQATGERKAALEKLKTATITYYTSLYPYYSKEIEYNQQMLDILSKVYERTKRQLEQQHILEGRFFNSSTERTRAIEARKTREAQVQQRAAWMKEQDKIAELYASGIKDDKARITKLHEIKLKEIQESYDDQALKNAEIYAENVKYQKEMDAADAKSIKNAESLQKAFFGITDGLMSAWSTMESIFHRTDAHTQRLFQVIRGIESVINSISTIVKDVGIVASWFGGSSGPGKSGSNIGGIIGAGASLFGSIKGIFGGSGTPEAVKAATVAGKVNPSNAATIAKAGINAAAMIPGPQMPFVAAGAAITDFASSMHWFANGGVVKHPMIAGVGEKGHEAIIPLDKYTYAPKNRGGNSMRVELGGSITASGRDFIIGLNKAQTMMAGSGI